MTPLQADEIRKMEKVCQLATDVLFYVGRFVKPNISTNELDHLAHDYTLSKGAVPAPLNYKGFPKSICTSVNECICHGVPDHRILKDGDIVNIDITCVKEGFYGDTSHTFYVGDKVSKVASKLTECAFKAMWKGIEAIRPEGATGDIGFAIEKFVNRKSFYVVREIGGHGIGREFHMDPFVPSFGKKGRGDRLKPWTCITVEPMVNETSAPIQSFSIPNSSIEHYETSDKTLSAQFEHTILITDKSYEVLTSNEVEDKFFT